MSTDPEGSPDAETDEQTLAVIDETTPTVGGGICYVVASGVLLSDAVKAREVMRSVIPTGRMWPFHWNEEGVVAKSAMVDALSQIGVVGRSIVVPCGRRSPELARAVGLAGLIEQLLDDGIDQLLIESRTPAQNGRDRAVILDVLRGRPETSAPPATAGRVRKMSCSGSPTQSAEPCATT